MTFQRKLILSLFVPIFILFRLSSGIDFDEGCFLDEDSGGGGGGANGSVKNISLQLAFVIDRTFSMEIARKAFALVITPLRATLKTTYERIQFGVSMFADWPKSAEPDLGRLNVEELGHNPHDNPYKFYKIKQDYESCYTREVAFTEDFQRVQKVILDSKSIANGGRENSLAALAFTVMDKDMHWENGKVRKVVMVLTERTYGNISNPGSRGDFKGDGTDKCATSKPPVISQVGDIFIKNKIAVIALIPPSTFEKNVYQWYVDHIGKLPTVPFCGKEFDLKANLDAGKIVDFVKGCLLGFGTGDGGGGGGGGEGSGGGGMKGDQCVYGDPPGINTLGY